MNVVKEVIFAVVRTTAPRSRPTTGRSLSYASPRTSRIE